MNQKKIAKLTLQLINELGEDGNREGLRKTPQRVANAYIKIFGGYKQDPKKIITVFDSDNYDEMVICKDIEFYSTCEHHLQPFFGKISIGYIPDKKIIGLSKLPRLVEIYARRMQNQERLTMQIADVIAKLLKPKGVGVVVEAKHLCLMARGVEKQGATMTTSYCKGLFRTNESTRNEFLKLIR
ncbi:MAG: GTP cyclohydrolase I FolE [Patescibacteria group bacterium]